MAMRHLASLLPGLAAASAAITGKALAHHVVEVGGGAQHVGLR